jgi:hypothetical protein
MAMIILRISLQFIAIAFAYLTFELPFEHMGDTRKVLAFLWFGLWIVLAHVAANRVERERESK